MKNHNLLMPIFCIVVTLFASSLHAGTSDGISLADAIRLTLEKNPQFRSYQLRGEALVGELETAQLKPALRASTEVENFLGTGDLNWLQGTELTLALSRVIELSDKRSARSNVVTQRQQLLRAEQRILELDMLSETTTHYIELATAFEMRELLTRSTDLAREILSEVSARAAAGRTPDADRSRAAATLAMAELTEQSAEFRIASASLQLTALWGSANTTTTSTQTALLLQVEQLADVDSLLAQLGSNPAIEVFASEARLREAELRAARAMRSANIEVDAGIRHLTELNDTALTFRVEMPLASRQRARGAITTAQANLLRVESDQAAALLRMRARLLVLDQQRRSAVNEFNTLNSSVLPQLQEAMEATRVAYESGRYSYLELSAAQQELLDAELALIEAANRAHLLRVEVERLSGETYREMFEPVFDEAVTGETRL